MGTFYAETWPRPEPPAELPPAVEVEARVVMLPWQAAGLSYTASGYGLRIPTIYQVKWRGKWRRVYLCQISNAGTAYIGKPGAWEATIEKF